MKTIIQIGNGIQVEVTVHGDGKTTVWVGPSDAESQASEKIAMVVVDTAKATATAEVWR